LKQWRNCQAAVKAGTVRRRGIGANRTPKGEKSSHGGHGGELGGMAEGLLVDSRGIGARRTRKGRNHRTEVTEVAEGELGGWLKGP
jgi:hypothetical protein